MEETEARAKITALFPDVVLGDATLLPDDDWFVWEANGEMCYTVNTAGGVEEYARSAPRPRRRLPDLVFNLVLKSMPGNAQGVGPEILGYALDHVRARWAADRPPSGGTYPLRNQAGEVIGSWTWGWDGGA